MKRLGQSKLLVIPLTWRKACEFISQHHRHHKSPRGQKWAIGVIDESGTLRGVATAGRPIARSLDDALTIEVNRTCTDGFPNVNSALYGACTRIAAAMGYIRIITDIQEGESGTSLRAVGWIEGDSRKPRKNWADSSVGLRHLRDPKSLAQVARIRWSKELDQ